MNFKLTDKEYTDFFYEALESVTKFHFAFDLAIGQDIGFELYCLRSSLINEEKAEFDAAMSKGSKIDILDALCDLLYVLDGAFVSSKASKYSPYILKWKGYFEEHGSKDCVFSLQDNLCSFLDELLTPEKSFDLFESLCTCYSIIMNTATRFELPMVEGFRLVHQNNMSKLGEDGKPVRNDYGKIIKPSGYKPVDLSVLF
jgi:predicted HAD superfamily Cof-like phosphohydrolase